MKRELAKYIASRAANGEVLGLGSGSTAEMIVEELGARISSEGLSLSGVPTSKKIAELALSVGITVIDPNRDSSLDWGFDGADEVDPDLRLLKGRGGAMLFEKIIAKRCSKWVIAVTEEKLVKKLGEKFAVPIEIIPAARFDVEKDLREFGVTSVTLREKDGEAVRTDSGNYILDCSFTEILNKYEAQLKTLTGVVETGLFLEYSPEVVVSSQSEISLLKLTGKGVERSVLG